jgi:hypothetical protein
VLNDKSIDAQSWAIIRYALETNDPWLAELVRRADMGDTTEQLDFSQMPENNEDDSSDAKIEACVELICNAGSKASVALLVLMATLEKATHRKQSRMSRSISCLPAVRKQMSTAWLTLTSHSLRTNCFASDA